MELVNIFHNWTKDPSGQKTSSNTERRRTCFDGKWFSEAMWIQNDKIHPVLQSRRWRCAITLSQNSTWQIQQTGSKSGASILRWFFRDRKQVRRCWRHYWTEARTIKKHELTFEIEKNFQFVKNQNWLTVNLGLKSFPPLDLLKGKPDQPAMLALG